MMTYHWPSPAKINLFLYITGRRADGYHSLQTLFQCLDYGDIMSITTTVNSQIRLNKKIAADIAEKDNLVIRAAQLLQLYCWDKDDPLAPGADIYLKKILPIGSGLGGGSSNAATALLALNFQWNCKLDLITLGQIGLKLGADVPVFIYGKTAFSENIGEKLTPLTLKEKFFIITIPPISIATSRIFKHVELKRNTPSHSLIHIMNAPFYNDCESMVKKYYPEVERHLSWLLKYAPSRLTGTGACLFAEFNTQSDSFQVFSQAPTWMNCFIAQGVNISPLHRILSINYYQSI